MRKKRRSEVGGPRPNVSLVQVVSPAPDSKQRSVGESIVAIATLTRGIRVSKLSPSALPSTLRIVGDRSALVHSPIVLVSASRRGESQVPGWFPWDAARCVRMLRRLFTEGRGDRL